MIRKFLEATGEYALFLKMVFRKPEKWKIFWKQLIIESDKLILSSILLVGVISLFIGGLRRKKHSSLYHRFSSPVGADKAGSG